MNQHTFQRTMARIQLTAMELTSIIKKQTNLDSSFETFEGEGFVRFTMKTSDGSFVLGTVDLFPARIGAMVRQGNHTGAFGSDSKWESLVNQAIKSVK